jgi:preprotein translocase subunit YajC
MGMLLTEESTLFGSNAGIILVVYVVLIFGFVYFASVRPQKKEQKRVGAMLASMDIGDSVLTTSGFYGIIIDIADDTVIVEFGNNKNCRIPMQKSAIAQVEKAGE